MVTNEWLWEKVPYSNGSIPNPTSNIVLKTVSRARVKALNAASSWCFIYQKYEVLFIRPNTYFLWIEGQYAVKSIHSGIQHIRLNRYFLQKSNAFSEFLNVNLLRITAGAIHIQRQSWPKRAFWGCPVIDFLSIISISQNVLSYLGKVTPHSTLSFQQVLSGYELHSSN